MAKQVNPPTIEQYVQLAIKLRGEVINQCINLENAIEKYISYHFLPDEYNTDNSKKRNEFKKLFFWDTAMGFTRKRIIFMELIKEYEPGFIKSHSEVYNGLKSIVKYRNDFAHAALDFTRKGAADVSENAVHLQAKFHQSQKFSEAHAGRMISLINYATAAILHWKPDMAFLSN